MGVLRIIGVVAREQASEGRHIGVQGLRIANPEPPGRRQESGGSGDRVGKLFDRRTIRKVGWYLDAKVVLVFQPSLEGVSSDVAPIY